MLHIILNYLAIHHKDVFALLGGSAGLSVILESLLLKLKRSKWHVDSKKISYTLLHVFAAFTTIATYALSHLPKADTATIYGSLVIAAETWHRFAVSPIYGKYVIPFLDWIANAKTVNEPIVGKYSSDTVNPDQFL